MVGERAVVGPDATHRFRRVGPKIGLAVIEMPAEVVMRYVNGKYIRDSAYVPPKSSRHYAVHAWTTAKELPCGRRRLIA